MTELRLKSVFVKVIVPYIIALLCAGFACTQVVFLTIINCLSSLSMKLTFGWFTTLLIVNFDSFCTINAPAPKFSA